MATTHDRCICLSIENYAEVYVSCEPVCAQWYRLATRLYLTEPTISTIQKDVNDSYERLGKVVSAWLKRNSANQPAPSWRLLCEALSPLDKALSERISQQHSCQCALCTTSTATASLNRTSTGNSFIPGINRATPVAVAVNMSDARAATDRLKKDFNDLLEFMANEIKCVNTNQLRLKISQYFKNEEGEISIEVEGHLSKIEEYEKPNAVLNYFVRHDFIGYINYSLIKVFQEMAKSALLAKRIEEYEKDYHCFLELTLSDIHSVFQQCPDLRPEYPAGIPKFTIHLQSEWDGRSMLNLREFLQQCFYHDCVDELMIAKISKNCIMMTFAVLPHIAERMVEYLTNSDVISTLKSKGITVDNISPQLLKYLPEPPESNLTDEEVLSEVATELDLLGGQPVPVQGMLSIKPNWNRFPDESSSGFYSGVSEGVDIKDDINLKDTDESILSCWFKISETIEAFQKMISQQLERELDAPNEKLEAGETTSWSQEIQKMKDQKQSLESLVNKLREEALFLQQTIDSRIPVLYHHHSMLRYPPVDITMNRFSERKKMKEHSYSPSFYSHPRGYKLCIKMRACGQYEGEGTHLSLSAYLMSGDYDHQLSWPFRGEIKLQLLNQRADRGHIDATIRFDSSTSPDASGRVLSGLKTPSGIVAGRGVPIATLVRHEDLPYNPTTGTEYLRDDAVFVRVSQVIVDQQQASTVVTDKPPKAPSFIAEFTVSNFSQLRDRNEKWESEPFYTHPNGYKFLLAVHPNGKDPFRGKSVSVYTHIMKGEHDGKLNFPFRGIITVQLLNLRENKNHVQCRIDYTAEADPEGRFGARVGTFSAANLIAGRSYNGWGYPDFVKHEFLPYNSEHNTQYLSDDAKLVFRIASVQTK